MKKLMIAAAIVCAAAVSQAATVSWKTGTISFDGDGSAASGGTSVKKSANGYLYYFATEEAYTTALATIALQDSTTASWAKDFMAANTAKVGPTATSSYGKLTLADATDYAEGKTLYGVVIATKEVEGETYYMVNASTFTMGTVDETVQNLELTLGGDKVTSTTAIKWNAVASVPEPTSAMLLLLGVAGLALRRRRA